jgi:SAM-dependent methyltransferase
MALTLAEHADSVKLDLGCGTKKREGFRGVDRRVFPGVDVVHDLRKMPWPFEDNSVHEVHCSHFFEHLHCNEDKPERVQFCNELYRILVPGGKATIITPHWSSCRAYGDFTHADKPVSEFFWLYLSREWRAREAPDTDIAWNEKGFSCDFHVVAGHTVRPELRVKSDQTQQFAATHYKDAIEDMFATLTKL